MTDSSHAHGSGDTKERHPVQETLTHPMETMTAAVEKVPGADRAKEFVDGVLDSVGIVSPRARRVAAYTGAGLLGVAGVIEWPLAAAGAAAVWLTQQRPKDAAAADEARAEESRTKRTGRSAKASTVAGKAKSRSGKATTRPSKASAGTAKSRTPKSASTKAKARPSGRTTKSTAAGTSRTRAGGRKKT
ncbi:hypothetical protein ACF1BP_31555 [Streptomyces sp. NPDC014735]|uniref:hypothetical protein n=1 Tax=unclassified Streptomyces TaxID=2593676 RepID=UPI0011610EC0|nr:hypothetical protein [Streptomyces sp. CB01580]